MNYLIQSTEVYRVSTEEEAKNMIEEASKIYTLADAGYKYKEKKQKGEVVDYWYQVKLVKKFNDEKEPETNVEVEYKIGSAF